MSRAILLSVVLLCNVQIAEARNYLPLTPGNEWVFRGTNGTTMTVRVTGEAKIRGARCRIVQNTMGNNVTREYLAQDADGIRCYRSVSGERTLDFSPPHLRLKLPYAKGGTWQGKFTQDGATYVTQYRSTGSATVTVPAGRFACDRVGSTMTGPLGQMASTIWYCPGVGPVKQVVSMGQTNVAFELVKTNVRAAVKTGASARPQARYCPKCKAARPASHRFCPECGTATVLRTRATTRTSTKRRSKSTPKPALKRYESKDGKLVLYHPQGWRVRPSPAPGPGRYGAMIQNPDLTAAVMFLTVPLGQEVTDSIAMARSHLTDLSRVNRAVDVTWMKSSKDRSRTRLEARLTTINGQQIKVHIFYFHTPRIGTVYSLMAAPDKWQALLPSMAQIVANLAYSPEGVKRVQSKARKLAASDRRVSRPDRRALSPMALLAVAQSHRGRQLPLVQVTAPDQSFTIRIPRGWQWQGGVLQYWTSPDWQRKTHGVSFVSKEMLSPRATTIRVPGVIVSDYVPPPQALALVMADGKLSRNVKIIAETPAAKIVPEVAQYLRMLEGRGLRGDIRLMHVSFVNIPTGQTCRGLFSVSCFVSTLGLAWSCLIEGGWAPDREFDDYLPLYWRIVQSNRYNERFVGRAIAQQAARQRQLNQSLQRALAESREAFQGLQASFRRNSETRDYTSWLFSQTTLGHGSWVSQAEGGTLHQTDRWGIERETGDRIDLPEYNTFNFTGRSPWTGEDLEEVNTLPEWQRHIRGRR